MELGRRHLLAMLGGSAVLRGQEFEAASIKPSPPIKDGRMMVGMQMLPGGRILMGGVTVSLLIQQAYQVRDFQVVGGPEWIRSERYDITAKPENAASQEQVRLMMQSLLKDRFQLKFHRETKELPTYALVVTKGGPKFKVSDTPPPAEGEGRGRGGQMRMMGRGHFEANGLPVSALANQLAQTLGRSVIDKTGLTGNYDFKLDWTPDENQRGLIGGPGGETAPASAEGISIFTALQDQLGLKLESTKGPVETLVIEGVERASEN